MRVAILAGNGGLDRQRKRLLDTNNINGDIVSSITKRIIEEYNVLLVSSANNIPNLPVVLERVVLEQRIHVVYISKTASIGQFYNLINDPFFHLVQEWTIDVELPILLRTILKFHSRMVSLQQSYDRLDDRFETMNKTNRAKRILIDKGMTEQEAHQYIQKQAMDMRVSKKRFVSLIIEKKIDI